MLAQLLIAALVQASATPVQTASPLGVVANPDWVNVPKAADIAKYYPKAAFRDDLAGSAFLACNVDADGRLVECKAEKVGPEGAGFGEAALAMAEIFRMRPQTLDGRPVAGGWVRIPVNFIIPANLSSAPIRARHPDVKPDVVELDCRYIDLRLDNCFAMGGGGTKAAEVALKLAEQITLPALPTKRRQGRITLPILFTDASGVPTAPALVTRPAWTARPTSSEVFAARREAVGSSDIIGSASIECEVGAKGDLSHCAIASEAPSGTGFGRSAMKLASKFRMEPVDGYGFKVEGRRIRLPIRFSPPPK